MFNFCTHGQAYIFPSVNLTVQHEGMGPIGGRAPGKMTADPPVEKRDISSQRSVGSSGTISLTVNFLFYSHRLDVGTARYYAYHGNIEDLYPILTFSLIYILGSKARVRNSAPPCDEITSPGGSYVSFSTDNASPRVPNEVGYCHSIHNIPKIREKPQHHHK